MPPSNLEVRKYEGRATVEGSKQRPIIRGHAIVFNEPSLVLASFMGGGFQEVIRPGAWNVRAQEKIDLRAFIDHDSGRILGRQSAGTLRASVDRTGLRVEIDPHPEIEDHASLLRSIERGDITGMSFSFQTMPDGEQWDKRTDPPTREVTDMRVFEVSVVAMPAYEQTDVEVALRSRAVALGHELSIAQRRAAQEARARSWRTRG